ncbi:hypothetical protein E1H12_09675 [Geitlerinema sp. P-1104]|uniref:DUF6825 family protein n=1 Tax=Geitlerinema sp. P-1104 TaxID=2546230 RepID=UPI001476D899|nr:hypothetical protein [Geitlerinema sp. P-1104]NMG58786.1 hypothetical protein [Geitlerinema sp. P-1104]
MSKSPVHAFFVGRILAEEIGAVLERTVSNSLSAFGQFDAEQRENLRQFSERVVERAERVESDRTTGGSSSGSRPVSTDQDLQALIDGLRAEIAELRSELQRYRNRSDND